MKYMISLLVLAVAAQAQYPYFYGAYAPNVYSGVIPSTYTTYTAPIPAAPVATRISAPVVTSYAAPIPVAPAVTSTQYHSQDELGQASFGYAHPGQAATNYRDAFGNQVGSYAYINPEGKHVQVSYVADSNGFRVLSNDLPVGPVAQEVIALESPVPVEDTAEVVEAKAIHFKAIEDAKNGVVAPLPVVEAVELPQSVEDTPEVAAAKAEHAAAHTAALAAANASPVVEDAPVEVAVETAPAVVEDAPAEVAVEAVPSETVVEDAPVEITVVSAPAEAELPKPVEDTPEVAAAKIEHAAAHAAALAAAEASPALERKRRQIPFYPFPYFAASQRGADYVWRSVDADKDGQPDLPAVVSYVAPVVPAMTYTIPNTPFRYYN